ncbi:uncharacterized protein LOC131432725 [Malaya genurostris]|uniref:uncharacterized protein LOC131432725 n=1 Tax=Malaya genurostris TaxID=325434 RepID=UPI0026F3A0A8|nr:uncharacterized protein LOC131432725 [Malaya genurostris]
MSFKAQLSVLLLLLLILSFSFYGTALDCSSCQSRYNHSHCVKVSSQMTCSLGLVAQTQRPLLSLNPSLKTSGRSENFQCFRLNYTTWDGERHYQMGCTNNTRFCEGWTVRRNCTVLGVIPAHVVRDPPVAGVTSNRNNSRTLRSTAALALWALALLMLPRYFLINKLQTH